MNPRPNHSKAERGSNMRNIWTIARRELKLYFISPIAYIIMLVTFLILGLIFYVSIMDAYMQQYTPPTI